MDGIIAAIVIGVFIGWIWKRKTDDPKPNTTTPPTDSTAPGGENSDEPS
tara:strand:- start:52 stop:198 length:147 start_codon:yes stop_codon:yes gene_type:complete